MAVSYVDEYGNVKWFKTELSKMKYIRYVKARLKEEGKLRYRRKVMNES